MVAIRTPEEIRDGALITLKNALIRRGVTNPPVLPGSDFYLEFTAIANEVSVADANFFTALQGVFADGGDLEDLTRVADAFRIAGLRPASRSQGSASLVTTSPTLVNDGAQAVDANGAIYEVVGGGIVSTGDVFTIRSVATGEATNLPEGATLRWLLPPPFAQSEFAVAAGGLKGGADVESVDAFRARIGDWFAHPPKSGNPAHVASFAEAADASVGKAFVYPGAEGPGTIHVAVAARPSVTNVNRELDGTLVSGTIAPFVVGQCPGHPYVQVNSVQNSPATVVVALAMTKGWLDPSPAMLWDGGLWPRVTLASSGTSIVVASAIQPTVGKRLSYIDRRTWRVYTATILASTLSFANHWQLTLSDSFPGVAANDFIFPALTNAQSYVDAIVARFALMGPGEKLAAFSPLTAGGRRQPISDESWPSGIDGAFLSVVERTDPAIATSFFYLRAAGAATSVSPFAPFVPALPASLADGPRIFTPYHVAFYPAVL